LRFNKLLLDGAGYASVGNGVVLAARLRFGVVVGPSLSFSNTALFVPQQERLFAGGPTTVRGYNQNELGPAAYIPAGYDTVRANGRPGGDPSNPADTVYFRASSSSPGPRIVPTGGNAMVVAMLEARIPSPLLTNVLQFTAFTDAGAVWNRGATGEILGFGTLRWTPGIGVRARTFFGVLRVDVAYNPYARPGGAAYFDAPVAAGGALFCVSPGNTLRVTASSDGKVQQASGACPVSFQPPRASSFFRRLTPSISIGQAF
jgi:outer membrane protein assembly factor BamA